MNTPHPTDAIDVDAAIATMTRCYVQGGFWDERAIRLRPELRDALDQDRRHLLEVLAEDDEALDPEADADADGNLVGAEADAIARWMPLRAAHSLGVLRLIEPIDGMIPVWRAIQCDPEKVRSKLGVHWCWDPNYGGGADCHWPTEYEDKDLPEILLVGMVPTTSVDWATTMLCAMDFQNGDDERELRLLEDAPVLLVDMHVAADPVPVPGRLRSGCTA